MSNLMFIRQVYCAYLRRLLYLFNMGNSGNVIGRFSSSLDRRDQGPNEVIAQAIVDDAGGDLLEEVVQVIHSKAATRTINDVVMTLMAVSRIHPKLLVQKADVFIDLLESKSNRQVWGSMIALANMAPLVKEKLKPHLVKILQAMDEGTVVTRDHGFSILTELYKEDQSGDLLALINEQLLNAPSNQVGQYTEKFMEVVRKEDVSTFVEALEVRGQELTNEHHLKRLGKNLKNLRGL
ncbi:MAG: hypothetical protein R8G66_29120 [Cytophagales bacterium]|nr:hypothetical protein [Cytophagales bacterium]